MYATVSEHVAPGKRGRSLSWIINGQSLSLLVGVPLITLLGNWGGWRGAHGAATALCTLFVVWVVSRRATHVGDAHRHGVPLRALLRPRLVALLGAGTTERMCFAVIAMYVRIYLQRSYEVKLSALAVIASMPSGVRPCFGGRAGDRGR